jgi:hypothetical protein
MQLVDVPVPKPKKGEVLVKVEVAGINTVDWKIQGGLLKHILPLKFPHIPGSNHSLFYCDTASNFRRKYILFLKRNTPNISLSWAACCHKSVYRLQC